MKKLTKVLGGTVLGLGGAAAVVYWLVKKNNACNECMFAATGPHLHSVATADSICNKCAKQAMSNSGRFLELAELNGAESLAMARADIVTIYQRTNYNVPLDVAEKYNLHEAHAPTTPAPASGYVY